MVGMRFGILGWMLWVFGTALVRAIRFRWPGRRTIVLVGAIVVGMAWQRYGTDITLYLKFAANLHAYRLIAKNTTAKDPCFWSGKSTPFLHDPDNARTAFKWQSWGLDNWCGIVHDPRGFTARFHDDWVSEERFCVASWGHLRHCESIRGPWLYCCFT